MRLVCPNCGAQYEVDERVIPDAGRDVQCSACGHAWYQQPSGRPESEDLAPASADEQLDPDADEDEDEGEDGGAQGDEDGGEDGDRDEDAPTTASQAEAQADDQKDDAEADGGQHPEQRDDTDDRDMPQMPLRREIGEDVRGILQEEAHRELEARAQDFGQGQAHEPQEVATQPDLGLDEASAEEERRRIARERMARMRGIDEDDEPDVSFETAAPVAAAASTAVAPEPVTAAAEPAHRRDLFPDIEEINSTLDGRNTPGNAGEPGAETEKSGGFARGFFFVVLIAVLALVLYILAPGLAAKVPALEPLLSSYVDAINGARGWLDGAIQSMILSLEEKARGGN